VNNDYNLMSGHSELTQSRGGLCNNKCQLLTDAETFIGNVGRNGGEILEIKLEEGETRG
jgi:hypothetical protein